MVSSAKQHQLLLNRIFFLIAILRLPNQKNLKVTNANHQRRRAISIRAEGNKFPVKIMLPRRQLQGFAGLHGERQLTYEIS